MMRSILFQILIVLPLVISAQLTQLNSGTNSNLLDLSIIEENIVICGTNNYLVKSYDECFHLSPLAVPGPSGYLNRLVRLDTTNAFMLSYTPGQTLIYKTSDGGYNWTEKLDTSGAYNRQIDFFDSHEGFFSEGKKIVRTKDGGDSWYHGYNFPDLISISSIKTNNDSMVCVGGIGLNGTGDFYLSKDRGHSWPYVWATWNSPSNFFFLNRDTILCISYHGEFTKTIDGGANWTDYSGNEPTVPIAYSVLFKNYKEGYMVGATTQSVGLIAKTTDLGKSWYTYNTGINSVLLNMAFLNDSIAIITGSNGTLLRWNYKNTVFTGIEDNNFTENGFRIFPNPTRDKFILENRNKNSVVIEISNSLGQLVLQTISDGEREEFNTSAFPRGVFFLKIQSSKGSFVKKLVKE